MIELKIDPEFRDKIPPLTDAEYEQLKENILSDGEVYEPICVWDGTIVDGHNRWKIIQEHPEIPYRIKELSFADKWAAFDWMYKKQLGRRNLSDEQKTYLLGKLYEARKKSIGNTVSARKDDGTFQRMQNDFIGEHNGRTMRTYDTIAQEQGVNASTVQRAERFAKGLDAIREVSAEAADKILQGDSNKTKTEVAEIRNASVEEVKDFANAVLENKPRVRTNQNAGFNKERREQKKLVDAVIADMYSPEIKPFTIEMLEEEIEINGKNYIDLLRGQLVERSTLLVGDNRPRVVSKIDYIVSEIQKIRGLVT